MINQLLICEADLPKLVGKLILMRADDEHDLVKNSNKNLILEKRLRLVVENGGGYCLAHLQQGYTMVFRNKTTFIHHVNDRSDSKRFLSLVTPAELKIIQQWQLEDLEKL